MKSIKNFFLNIKKYICDFFKNKQKRLIFIIASSTTFALSLSLIIATACSLNYPDYIYIETEEDLEQIREHLDGDFIFTKQNINISHDWTPIGSFDEPFTGTINGNGCTISYSQKTYTFIEEESLNYFGFFANNKGTIRGLSFYLHDMTFNLENDNKSVFGCVSAYNSGTISNCSIIQAVGSINISSNEEIIAGGVCGIGSHNFLKNKCSARFNLNSDNRVVCGGIVGLADEQISMWETSATCELSVSGTNYVCGGLIGAVEAGEGSSIINCLTRCTFLRNHDNFGTNGGVIGSSSLNSFSLKNIYSNCNMTNYSDVKNSNFVGDGLFSITSCVSNPNFKNELSDAQYGSYAYSSTVNIAVTHSYFTKRHKYSFDGFGEFTELQNLTVEKLNWDKKIWRKEADGSFKILP